MVAIFLFALPSLGYLFLASLWAMRLLQDLIHRSRRW